MSFDAATPYAVYTATEVDVLVRTPLHRRHVTCGIFTRRQRWLPITVVTPVDVSVAAAEPVRSSTNFRTSDRTTAPQRCGCSWRRCRHGGVASVRGAWKAPRNGLDRGAYVAAAAAVTSDDITATKNFLDFYRLPPRALRYTVHTPMAVVDEAIMRVHETVKTWHGYSLPCVRGTRIAVQQLSTYRVRNARSTVACPSRAAQINHRRRRLGTRIERWTGTLRSDGRLRIFFIFF